ncbi:MAG: hypothetical protein HKM24_07405 [Gammaproteobacteria bacterium]|nr:hypothetical protein [Gammaproteobacteria bacterium]
MRLLITVLVSTLLIAGCGSGSSSFTDSVAAYCLGDFNELTITNGGGSETYSLVVREAGPTPISMSGVRSGSLLMLSGSAGGITFDYDVTISGDESSATAAALATVGSDSFAWNEFGTLGSCPTVDLTAGVPQLAATDFVDVANDIQDISMFRSAYGHDYSDEFETCRSMKHYYSPPMAKRINNTVAVYSPVDGTIVRLGREDSDPDDGMTNQKVIIQSDDDAAMNVVLFHIDLLSPPLAVGDTVTAGQQVGFANLFRDGSSSHDFDIAVHANATDSVRYISYFEFMTNTLFANYSSYGTMLDEFIISESERDMDPLTCSGEDFTSSGTLPSWFYNLP